MGSFMSSPEGTNATPSTIIVSTKPSLLRSKKRRKMNEEIGNSANALTTTIPTKNTSHVIIVQPKVRCKYPINACALLPKEHNADRVLAAPLYLKWDDARKEEYVKSLHIAKRVFSCKRASGGPHMIHSNGFRTTRALAFGLPQDYGLSDVVTHVNDTIFQNSQSYMAKHQADTDGKLSQWFLEGNQYPYIVNPGDTETVRTVDYYCQAFNKWEDIVFLINHELNNIATSTGEKAISFQQWLSMDTNHIYTLYPEGQISWEMITANNLNEKHMKQADYLKYKVHRNKEAANTNRHGRFIHRRAPWGFGDGY